MTAFKTVELNDVPMLLARLRRESFYGSLEIKLEAGQVVLLKKIETIKPNCRDNRGRDASFPEHR